VGGKDDCVGGSESNLTWRNVEKLWFVRASENVWQQSQRPQLTTQYPCIDMKARLGVGKEGCFTPQESVHHKYSADAPSAWQAQETTRCTDDC